MKTYLLIILFTIGLAATGLSQENQSVTAAVGDHNHAIVSQTGTQHHSDVYQNGVNATGQQNLAIVKQENLDGDFSNEAVIRQYGTAHESVAEQKGDNKIEVLIGAPGTANTANKTYGRQGGALNEAYQHIFGADATRTSLDIRQYGSGNFGWQYASDSRLSTAKGIQAGGMNILNQLIEGLDNQLRIEQVGNANTAGQQIAGYGSGNNEAVTGQYGDYNRAAVGIEGNLNVFSAEQYGEANLITGSRSVLTQAAAGQQGDRNSMHLSQYGDDNTMYLDQTGNDNRIAGPGANFAALQLGDGNMLEVSQSGDANISDSGQILHHNQATILQTGLTQQSFLRQTGISNTATVTQGN